MVTAEVEGRMGTEKRMIAQDKILRTTGFQEQERQQKRNSGKKPERQEKNRESGGRSFRDAEKCVF